MTTNEARMEEKRKSAAELTRINNEMDPDKKALLEAQIQSCLEYHQRLIEEAAMRLSPQVKEQMSVRPDEEKGTVIWDLSRVINPKGPAEVQAMSSIMDSLIQDQLASDGTRMIIVAGDGDKTRDTALFLLTIKGEKTLVTMEIEPDASRRYMDIIRIARAELKKQS
jgi:hypothetical protein